VNTYQLEKAIREKLNYRIVGKEWGRLGSMKKKYGEEAVEKSIDEIAAWSFQPPSLLDALEKQCQKFTKREKNKLDQEIEDLL
jgi:hypothetical protein